VRVSSANAFDLLRGYDVVIDGTDNFPTRYLLNDACVLLGIPNIYGAIFRFHGQVSVFSPPAGPCYRCLYPEPPPPETVPNCAEGGVLGILPGVIGSLQATEAIKLILGKGRSLAGRLVLYDALEMEFRELAVARDPACPVCGDRPTIRELIDYEAFCGTGARGSARETTPAETKCRLERNDAFQLLDVRTAGEWEICHIGGAVLIPLGELPARLGELDREKEVVVYCKSGARSAAAAAILAGAGFRNVAVMAGGVTAWAATVDPAMPVY
jgi:adenylyltransferase/sulfurtransferase